MQPKTQAGAFDWLAWLALAICVIAIWLGAWLYVDNYIFSPDLKSISDETSRGVFGDKFGAVNSLFSGLAFAGIIFTILLQRRELSLQRSEIVDQNETLRQQRFENSFFHLLALHADNVDKLVINAHSRRQAITYFTEILKGNNAEFAAFQPLSRLTTAQLHELRASKVLDTAMRKQLEQAEISTIEAMLEQKPGIIGKFLDTNKSFHHDLIDSAYMTAHLISKDGLSHYFRTLYHIYKFIDDSVLISDDQKKSYGRIVRAQLSDDELKAILYNSLARDTTKNGLELGYPKMTSLVKKYEILKNINESQVIHPIHLEILQQFKLEQL